jgi:hypothetical protein
MLALCMGGKKLIKEKKLIKGINYQIIIQFTFHFKEMMAMQKDPDAWLDFFFQQLDKHDVGDAN